MKTKTPHRLAPEGWRKLRIGTIIREDDYATANTNWTEGSNPSLIQPGMLTGPTGGWISAQGLRRIGDVYDKGTAELLFFVRRKGAVQKLDKTSQAQFTVHVTFDPLVLDADTIKRNLSVLLVTSFNNPSCTCKI